MCGLWLCLLAQGACVDRAVGGPKGLCGDGVVDPGEACDGEDLGGQTCPSASAHLQGTPVCTSECTLDLSACHTCGDGVLQPTEACDGEALGGQSCASLGYDFGELRCANGCQLDVSACRIHGLCGNGLLDWDEQCDGPLLGGETCASVTGLGDGELRCSVDCTFDTSDCHQCGDAELQGPERCDGSALAGNDCATLTGLSDGALGCRADCLEFDISACHTCGDGVVQGDEECDGLQLGGHTCASLGFVGGTMSCSALCALDVSGCSTCGDGIVDPDDLCDGAQLGGATCASVTGHPNGVLACDPSCQSYDTTGCHTCGDQTLQGPEVCDGNNLAGQSCQSLLGHVSGSLACGGDCLAFDPGDCHTCGDGVAQGPEPCDGSDLAGATCTSSGFSGGSVVCGATCAVDTSGCYQCGDGACDESLGESHASCPTDCDFPGWTFITGGYQTSCGVRGNGLAYCWGRDGAGQLGYDAQGNSWTPVEVWYLTEVVSLDNGYGHACAVTADHQGWCWGYDWWGQVGNGPSIGYPYPNHVTSYGDALIIGCGAYHTCGIRTDGSVDCWGQDDYGQVANGVGYQDEEVPTPVAGLPAAAVDVSLGAFFSCALLSSGEVWCWGKNWDGQLGNGLIGGESHVPVQVMGLTNAIQLSAGMGGDHACALRTDHTVWCWGRGYDYQLGNGSQADQGSPVQAAITNVTSVSAGRYHTCALKSDGTLWCWGHGTWGQLGHGTDGIYANRQQPTQVINLQSVVHVSAGQEFTCAIVSDGTGYCWGYGNDGALGNGTQSAFPAPEPVVFP